MGKRTLKAELAGTVLQIERQTGDAVELDDVILILESMKMEIPVCAPCAGRVVEVLVGVGDAVTEDQALAAIET